VGEVEAIRRRVRDGKGAESQRGETQGWRGNGSNGSDLLCLLLLQWKVLLSPSVPLSGPAGQWFTG